MTIPEGIVEIANSTDAQSAWISFFNRFFSPEIPKDVDVTFEPQLREFKPRANQQAKYQHPHTLVGRTSHSDDFDDFLNNYTVTIPEHITLTQEGLEQVKNALLTGNYNHECFQKPDHVFYALWLFKQNLISRQQMSTILARDQFPAEYPIQHTHKILDENGQFSAMAREILLPLIATNPSYHGAFTEWHLERFRLLIQAAPPSEQIFYTSTAIPAHEKRQLSDALFAHYAWHKVKIKGQYYNVHYSFAAIEAIQIAQKGVNGAAASRAKIGVVKIDDVKEGVEYYYRPTAISIKNSGVEATTKDIHSYQESPMPVVTAHDIFHLKLHNTILPEYHLMLNHMAEMITQHTGRKWSKAKWQLVDRVFYTQSGENPADELAKYFFRNLQKGIMIEHSKNNVYLSDDGFAIAWNMIRNEELWKNLYKVNINNLDKPGRYLDSLIKELKSFSNALKIKENTPKILTLKYRLYCSAPKSDYQYLIDIIDEFPNAYDTKLYFGSYTKNRIKNLTTLKFQVSSNKQTTDPRVSAKSIKNLTPKLIQVYLLQKFSQPNEDLIQPKVEELKKYFKSMHEGGTFSKEILKNSIHTLQNISDKLSFLDVCYEEIIQGNNYTRRHAHIDKIFSFFKSPLTTSQRTHISILKEQLNQVIKEHSETITNTEEKDKFLWLMKNRGSELAQAKTDRFYLNSKSSHHSPKI